MEHHTIETQTAPSSARSARWLPSRRRCGWQGRASAAAGAAFTQVGAAGPAPPAPSPGAACSPSSHGGEQGQAGAVPLGLVGKLSSQAVSHAVPPIQLLQACAGGWHGGISVLRAGRQAGMQAGGRKAGRQAGRQAPAPLISSSAIRSSRSRASHSPLPSPGRRLQTPGPAHCTAGAR